MTIDHCANWRGLVAMEVVGQLLPEDRIALDAHLDGCAACRAERAELLPLERALAATDPRRVEESRPADASVVPPGLGDAVLVRLRAEARRERSRRRIRSSLLSAAAAVVVAAGIALGLQPWAGGTGAHTLALSGTPGVRASVTLVPEAWGTRLELRETGQPAGQVLTVSMRSRAGRWWDAGSYRSATNGTVEVELACAAPASEVYAVYVRDSSGRTVLHAEPA